MRLTTANIQNTPPQKKAVRLFDGRGLYLEIAPTGSRWWRFKYRFAQLHFSHHWLAGPVRREDVSLRGNFLHKVFGYADCFWRKQIAYSAK